MQYTEYTTKLQKLRSSLKEKQLPCILITLQHNFAWLTCGGRNYVGIHSERGVASIFVDDSHVAIVTNNIEAPRIIAEELSACPLREHEDRVTVHFEPWYSPTFSTPKAQLYNYGLISSVDAPVETDEGAIGSSIMSSLRTSLSPQEMDRYRQLGYDCAESISKVAHGLHRGVQESAVAASLSKLCLEMSIVPIVLLVAADERIHHFRHPLPSYDKKANETIMIVLCGRRHGLIVSVTRLVHFGEIPQELKKKHHAVTYVNAVAYANTKQGKKANEVFEAIKLAYEEKGYSDEWMLHHQGGLTGYMSREWRASPTCTNLIVENSAFAYNPSITGTKSEDTVLLTDQGDIEVITPIVFWPVIQHEINGQVYKFADILQK
jgi:antitoxin VapB